MALQLYSLMAVTLIAITISCSSRVHSIGVNWGTTASHPLPPSKVVELLKLNKITKVKLFDSNPQVLEALSGSNIDVTVGIPNSMLRSLNSSLKAAESWVHDNLTRYLSGHTRIEYVAVGDDPFLQTYGSQFYPFVVGAAMSIEAALIRAKLATKVKIVIPCSFDAFQSESNRPSTGHFRPDINKTMIAVLNFLTKTHSPFFVTISPFLSHYQNKNISLDFALFKETARPHNDTHNRSYKNSLDLSYDTLITALTVAGFPEVNIVISQIGWPTDGAPNATVSNAKTFTKGLLDRINTQKGTPLRPRATPEIYLYTLVDEDQRNTTLGNFERHWGLFTFDGQAKYDVEFFRGTKGLVNALSVEYLAPRWCVVNNNLDMLNASARATEACANADCTALSPGSSCFNLSWPGNVSYAFNSYYQQHDQRAESCDFGGLGMITTVDPSVGDCRFNVELKASFSESFHGLNFWHYFVLTILMML